MLIKSWMSFDDNEKKDDTFPTTHTHTSKT